MTDLQKLNSMFGAQWKSAKDVDWIKIAKEMKPDLKFMKENAEFLRPGFVVMNPAIDTFKEPYSNWIEYVNHNVEYPEVDQTAISNVIKKIDSDPDFKDSYLEFYGDYGGFNGADQFQYDGKKLYMYDDAGTIIDLSKPWEEIKPVLLEQSKVDLDDLWNEEEDVEEL